MKWRLRYSPEARADLQSAKDYLYQEAGPRVAARYIRSLRDRLDRLREMPKTGVAIPEYGATVRFAPCRRHLIYYELENRTIVVLRILHSARDRDAIMSKKTE